MDAMSFELVCHVETRSLFSIYTAAILELCIHDFSQTRVKHC
jgi:hypothetical protein